MMGRCIDRLRKWFAPSAAAPGLRPPVFLPLVAEAWVSLGTNRVVAFLAMLGVIIGVGSVVLMVAIGTGSQQKVERAINSLGNNLLIIFPVSAEQPGLRLNTQAAVFTAGDIDSIAQLPSVEAVAYSTIQSNQDIASTFSSASANVTGTIPDFFGIRNWVFDDGDSFTAADIQLSNRVAVIGATVAEKLFPGQNPLGKTINIGEKKQGFLVIGTLERKGVGLDGTDQDNVIYVPASTFKNYFAPYGSSNIQMIFAKVISSDHMEDATDDIKEALRTRQKIPENTGDNFTVYNLVSITKVASDSAATFSLLLGSIASISLLVGSIGIMNIMLVTVSERTREIGIRKAIGATSRQIMIQFLLEAVIIATIGSIVGLAAGSGGGWAAQAWFDIPVAYSAWSVAMSLVMAGGIGIASGLYPAWKAAKMQPIDALRAVGA